MLGRRKRDIMCFLDYLKNRLNYIHECSVSTTRRNRRDESHKQRQHLIHQRLDDELPHEQNYANIKTLRKHVRINMIC